MCVLASQSRSIALLFPTVTATILAEHLRARISELGITQVEAARRCGTSESAFSYWLSDKGTLPSMDVLPKVAEFLVMDTDSVLAMYPSTYKIRQASGRALADEVDELRAMVKALATQVEALTAAVKRGK